MSSQLLFVVNDAAFFLSHRMGLALAARKSGYTEKIGTMPGPAVEKIRELGFEHYPIPRAVAVETLSTRLLRSLPS